MGRQEDRKNSYKKGVDPVASRRRRQDTTIQLRKAKKEEQLAKRRASVNLSTNVPLPTLSDLAGFLAVLKDPNTDANQRLFAIRGIRRMTSVSLNPPTEQLIAYGVLPLMVHYLTLDDEPTLQMEAAWVLTNLASTDRTMDVYRAGAMPGTVRLLKSPVGQVREQAAWLLGNLAGDSPFLRNKVLESGAMNILLMNVQTPHSQSLLQHVVWTISNLCRGTPEPPFSIVKHCIPAMRYAMAHQMTSDEAQIDALWTLSYLSDGSNDKIQAVVEGGIIPIAMSALSSGQGRFMAPSLRVLGNIVTGNAAQTQAVLDANILDIALSCLQDSRQIIRKETAWLLSNILAGERSQNAAVFAKRNVVSTLVEMVSSSAWPVRKEAIHAVGNMVLNCPPEQVSKLADTTEVIEAMSDILDLTDSSMVLVALDTIRGILRVGKAQGRRRYDLRFEEAEGLNKLEYLQHHTSTEVYDKAVGIVTEFYSPEDDAQEDENLAPSQGEGFYQFGFGSPETPSKNLFSSSSSFTSPKSPPATKFDFGSLNHNSKQS